MADGHRRQKRNCPRAGVGGKRGVRPNLVLVLSAMVAALGGLLFGFDTVVISGAQNQLRALFQLTGFWQGFMTASALVGTFIGSILAGKPGDIWGGATRRRARRRSISFRRWDARQR